MKISLNVIRFQILIVLTYLSLILYIEIGSEKTWKFPVKRDHSIFLEAARAGKYSTISSNKAKL